MRKYYMLICSLVLAGLLLLGCAYQVQENGTIYFSSKVKVVETSFAERNYGCYSWAELTMEEAFGQNTILSGVISNVREATVEFSLDGRTMTSPITLFDMTDPNVIFDSTDIADNKKTITVGVGYNSGTFSEGLPILSEGKQFLAFCCSTAIRSDDVLEIDKYADFWVWNPNNLLIEGTADTYIVSDFFFDYLAEEEKIKQSLNITEEKLTMLFENANQLSLAEHCRRVGISDYDGVLGVLADRYNGMSSDLKMMLASGYLVNKSGFEKLLQEVSQTYSRG